MTESKQSNVTTLAGSESFTSSAPVQSPGSLALVVQGISNQLNKLTQPFRPMGQLTRASLCERLCAEDTPAVCLLRAPAGFGKTVLMQQAYAALQQREVAVSWLRFDLADNDATRLLRFLVKATERIDPQRCPLAHDMSTGPLALELFDRVAQVATPIALFFDDLEVLQNPVALALIRQLIEHLPPRGRVIMGSRCLPDMGISQLRSSGRLLEIDVSSLRFSREETTAFFQARNPLQLSDELLQSLHETTEGWPVALWMVSLLLENAESTDNLIHHLSGNSRLIAEYLSEEVLAQQPRHIRQFLLQSSIFPQLCAELCDQVLQIDNSRTLLSELERANLFLMPLDTERQWFRYHSLFADYLQEQLKREYAQDLPGLHRRAAQWYLQQQRPVPAIEHALHSGDTEFALQLFSEHAERLLGEGRSLLLVRLLAQVPEQALRQWPNLQMVHVWSVSFTRGSSAAMELLAHYEMTGSSDVLRTHSAAVKPMLLSMMDRHQEAYAVADEHYNSEQHAVSFPQAVLCSTLAYATMVTGNLQRALQLLDQGRRSGVIDYSPFTHIYAQSVEGVTELLQGRLRQATSRFRLAAGIHQQDDRFATNGNAMAAILLAEVLYERGEVLECERLLHVYVPLMLLQGVPDHLICGHRALARILFARAEVDQALNSINQLEYYGQCQALPRVVASARLERARLFLLMGDADSSQEELVRAEALADWQGFEPWLLIGNDVEYLSLALLRWQIHFADPTTALRDIDREVAKAELASRGRRTFKLQVLQVMALYKANKESQSLSLLCRLLREALAEQSLQLILDEGELVLNPLRQLAGLAGVGRHDYGVCLAEDPARLFARALEAEALIVASDQKTIPLLAEQLTKKELLTLELLAQGLSNEGIAEKLFVSKNTVRTHLRNLYAKLGSQSRTQAVAIARRMELLN